MYVLYYIYVQRLGPRRPATPERIYGLQDQHDHRLSPPAGNFVLLGSRFLSHTRGLNTSTSDVVDTYR